MKTKSFLTSISITAVLSTAVLATNVAATSSSEPENENLVASSGSVIDDHDPVEYGVDVSFPIHRAKVSTNYPWLPHNVDPENNPTPDEYKDMPIQYLGNVQERYEEFMDGCRKHYRTRPRACDQTERDRVAMSLRQVSNILPVVVSTN